MQKTLNVGQITARPICFFVLGRQLNRSIGLSLRRSVRGSVHYRTSSFLRLIHVFITRLRWRPELFCAWRQKNGVFHVICLATEYTYARGPCPSAQLQDGVPQTHEQGLVVIISEYYFHDLLRARLWSSELHFFQVPEQQLLRFSAGLVDYFFAAEEYHL